MSERDQRDPHQAYWARWKFARLAEPMKERARELGYALLVHGSLARDIDVVAVAWTEEAVSASKLVGALAATIREFNHGIAFGETNQMGLSRNTRAWKITRKPHGRVAVAIHVGGVKDDPTDALLGTYVDLSIIPPRRRRRPRAA